MRGCGVWVPSVVGWIFRFLCFSVTILLQTQMKHAGAMKQRSWSFFCLSQWYSTRETQTVSYNDPNITRWFWVVLYTGKVKTSQVKEVPKSTSDWQRHTILIAFCHNPKRYDSSPESLCFVLKWGVEVCTFSFYDPSQDSARIKAALCSSCSPRVTPQWLHCPAEPVKHQVWQDMGIEGTLCRDLILQLPFLASTKLEHELLPGLSSQVKPCTG